MLYVPSIGWNQCEFRALALFASAQNVATFDVEVELSKEAESLLLAEQTIIERNFLFLPVIPRQTFNLFTFKNHCWFRGPIRSSNVAYIALVVIK